MATGRDYSGNVKNVKNRLALIMRQLSRDFFLFQLVDELPPFRYCVSLGFYVLERHSCSSYLDDKNCRVVNEKELGEKQS